MPTAESQIKPAPFRIDYAKASALKDQGLTVKQIAAILGVKPTTLSVGMSRHGLTKFIPVSKRSEPPDLSSQSNHVRSKLATHLVRGVENLDKLPIPTGLKRIQEHAKALNDLVPHAAKVFGWDSENDQKLVSVLVLSGYDPHDPPPVKAIDVQSLPAGSPLPEPVQDKPTNTVQGEG